MLDWADAPLLPIGISQSIEMPENQRVCVWRIESDSGDDWLLQFKSVVSEGNLRIEIVADFDAVHEANDSTLEFSKLNSNSSTLRIERLGLMEQSLSIDLDAFKL